MIYLRIQIVTQCDANWRSNRTIIQVILSPPIWPFTGRTGETHLRTSCSHMTDSGMVPFLRHLRTKVQTSLLFIEFQIPSHARIMKESPGLIFSLQTFTSGKALTACSQAVSRLLFFRVWSPKALAKLRPWLMRPLITWQPALSMRLLSMSSVGLWSFDIEIIFPLIQSTHRESPILAT